MATQTEDLVEKTTNGEVCVLRAGKEEIIDQNAGLYYAPATITLVQPYRNMPSKGYPHKRIENVLFDTGGFGEGYEVVQLLQAKGIQPSDISEVYITHNHPDHIGNVHRFGSITTPDSCFSTAVRKANEYRVTPEGYFSEPGKLMFAEEGSLNLVSTPGHSGWDMSGLFTGKDVRVLICGDLFWSEGDWKNDSSYLGLCVNREMQERSRDYVRTKLKPEIVIPGHGPAFRPKY